MNNESTFPFPIVHIHDIGHQVKNSQAALERGTHFDGKNSYNATDFSLIMSTCSNEVSEMMNRGVSHGTLAQFDKHSDEHSLQRISEPVIEACKEVGKLVRTDIPELRRPWFAENHATSISSPLFVTVSKNDAVFYTDDTNNSLVCYRQTPLPRKLIALSHIAAEEEDNVPDAPNKVRCDQAKWKEIGGLALCDEDCKLIVLYSGFCSIRVIANVGQLWRRPKAVLHIMRLTIHGNDFNFSPFAVSMCRPHSRRALITDPKNGCICLTEISEDFTVLSIIRKIVTDEIGRPICCLQFTPDALIVTCVLRHLTNNGTGVKFLTVDDEIKIEYSFHNTDFNIGFPFGICEATNGIYVADYAKHCHTLAPCWYCIKRRCYLYSGTSSKLPGSNTDVLLLRWPYQLPIILEWYCIINGSIFKAHGATEPSSGKGNKN